MAIALGQEKLAYTPEQLNVIQDQIRQGDLTAVLRVYEDDIKSPIRSAITGTLVRSLLIQVQKMKVGPSFLWIYASLRLYTMLNLILNLAQVDVDFALSGIDKLLRSQELTFGFVGVAPALAIVYLGFGWLRDSWSGGKGRGRYGGKRERARLWTTMRRIERLLISQPNLETPQMELLSSCKALGFVQSAAITGTRNGSRKAGTTTLMTQSNVGGYSGHPNEDGGSGSLSPLTNGLLLLSTTHLRTFAEAYLRRSRFKTGFLGDVSDLEDGRLGIEQKRLVLTRMWRSWGRPLGWDNLAEL